MKAKGQESTLNGVSTWTGHLTGELAELVLHSPKGDEIECMVFLDFHTTNNEAEYEALVAGLDLAKAVGVTSVVVYCDSQVVTS